MDHWIDGLLGGEVVRFNDPKIHKSIDPTLHFPLACLPSAIPLSPGMIWKRRITGGVLAFVGYMLSPLSWWNDLFVNLPLAILFAWIVSFFYRPAFEASVILGYWLTNVLGFVLLQKGGEKMFSKDDKPYTSRRFIRDMAISILYTGVIVVLVEMGILKPVTAYFENGGP